MIFITKKKSRVRRGFSLRQRLKKSGVCRLVVHRTSKHIYAQVINSRADVLASASTLELLIFKESKNTGNKNAASIVGKIIAERAIKKGITKLSFDRSGFKYHGRVKALADAAREYGLSF